MFLVKEVIKPTFANDRTRELRHPRFCEALRLELSLARCALTKVMVLAEPAVRLSIAGHSAEKQSMITIDWIT